MWSMGVVTFVTKLTLSYNCTERRIELYRPYNLPLSTFVNDGLFERPRRSFTRFDWAEKGQRVGVRYICLLDLSSNFRL